MNYRVHIVLALLCWMAGWIYMHGWLSVEIDHSVCIGHYDQGGWAADYPERPANWSPLRHLLYPFTSGKWSTYLVGGAITAAPAILYAGIPRRVRRLPLILIAFLAITPLIWFGLSTDGWHDCDRKGTDFAFSVVIVLPAQLLIMAVGSLFHGMLDIHEERGDWRDR